MTLAAKQGVSQQPDRRRTIDLIRVERGEPERRKLRRWSPAGLSVRVAVRAGRGETLSHALRTPGGSARSGRARDA